MSAKWMRIETDFVDHPKVMRLAAHLQVPEAVAGWYVMRAWSWVSRFCPTGQVRDIDGTALESACKWRGTDGNLIEALVASQWFEEWDIDGTRAGIEAHDWPEHQGCVAAKAAKERERKRAYRAKKAAELSQPVPRDNHGTSDETDAGRPAQRDVTGRDVTGRIKETAVEPGSTSPLVLVGEVVNDPKPDLEAKLTDDQWQVFEHWRVACRHPGAKPTDERRRQIAKWLPVYGVDGLQRAIDGCARSPWHQGQNDRHKRFDDLGLILRDAAHIEGFMSGTAERAS